VSGIYVRATQKRSYTDEKRIGEKPTGRRKNGSATLSTLQSVWLGRPYQQYKKYIPV